MQSADFEPAVPVVKRLQTAWGNMAKGIASSQVTLDIIQPMLTSARKGRNPEPEQSSPQPPIFFLKDSL
jgi:hypothetical protein